MAEKGSVSFEKVDISSHSAVLLNERIAGLYEVAHASAINFEVSPNFQELCKYYSCLKHIWLYVRQIVASETIRLKVDNDIFKVQKWVRYNQKRLLVNDKRGINYEEMLTVAGWLDNILDMINKILQKGSRYFFRTSNYFFSDRLVEDYARTLGVVERNIDDDMDVSDSALEGDDKEEIENILREAGYDEGRLEQWKKDYEKRGKKEKGLEGGENG